MAKPMVTSHYAVVTHGHQYKHHVEHGDGCLPNHSRRKYPAPIKQGDPQTSHHSNWIQTLLHT